MSERTIVSGYGYMYFGEDTKGIDIRFMGDTTGKYIEWDASANLLTFVGAKQNFGVFASAVAGSGIPLTNAATAAVRFYADDGGAAISATGSVPDVKNVLARTLITKDNSANKLRLFSVMGQIKSYDGEWGNEQVGAVHGYLELVRSSGTINFQSYGVTAGLMATVETSGTMTVDANHKLAGIAAISKMTSGLTQTGITAGLFVGIYDNTNWSDASIARSKWKYGIYLNDDAVERVLFAGTSSLPVTCDTASTKFYQQYTDCGATSGESVGMYVRNYVTGAGGSGIALRAFQSVQNVTGVDARGAHISLNFGATGKISGSGQALTTTLHIADQATQSGTLSAITCEIYSDGSTSDPSGASLSCIRFSNAGGTGKDDVDDDCAAFDFDSGWTAADGNMIAVDNSPTTIAGNVTHTIKVRIGGTIGYLPVLSAPVTA